MVKNSQPELDLFRYQTGDPFECLLQDLQQMCDGVVRKWDLPQQGVAVFPNFGQKGKSNEGKIVSYSVGIVECDFPATDADLHEGKRMRCVSFTQSDIKSRQGFIEILPIKNVVLEHVSIPDGALALPQDKTDRETDCRKLAIPIEASGIVNFFRNIVELKLKVYESSYASPFGCCSLFEECSDAKRCVHPNRLYSTACAYRHNLENGHIFYGKNKNI